MMSNEAEIPEKRYFRIREVSAITGIERYVLRYWETEFSQINPSRSRSGQRLYKKPDIEKILQIKDLLYNKRFTIAGARQYLKEQRQDPDQPEAKSGSATLEEVREELLAIRELLGG